MKIVLSGGGTGGHITPLLAVAHELKKQRPNTILIYVGEKQGRFRHLLDDQSVFDEIHEISAGKFRRYHNEAWLKKALDLKTLSLNSRDLFRFLAGYYQSLRLLKRIKPDVIFIKGGYVGAGVGLAAASLKLPYLTHDSDTMPGLANRMIARWATAHAVGMPKKYYKYPSQKTHFTGTPLPAAYRLVDETLKAKYRKQLKLPEGAQVVLITGGSLGARRLNEAVKKIMPDLLKKHSNLIVIHQTGKSGEGLYQNLEPGLKARLSSVEFIKDMHIYSGAADLIISRAGATTLAEFAAQGKACLIVPNAELTGGHQLQNAQYLIENQATKVIYESQLEPDPSPLLNSINELLDSDETRANLGRNLYLLAKPHSAADLAKLILDLAKTKT